MNFSEYIEVFNYEAQELLRSLNDALIQLEQQPDDNSVLEEIFRAAHTLKGMSATMDYDEIATITHKMETLLDKIRNGVVYPDSRVIDLIFESFDVLQEMVDARSENMIAEVDEEVIIQRLEDYIQSSTSELEEDKSKKLNQEDFTRNELEKLDSVLSSGLQVLRIHIFLAKDCVIKGARAYMAIKVISEVGEIIKTLPNIQSIEEEKFDLDFIVFIATNKESIKIEKKVKNISEIDQVEVEIFKNEKQKEIAKELKLNEKEKKSLLKGKTKTILSEAHTVRVNIEHLDNLVDLAGELVITRSKLERLRSYINLPEINDVLDELKVISSNLQTKVMETRMVPVGNIFNRFPRMVRDIAHKQGKEVNFIMEGNEIELDRTVLDEIGDPLVHLLRNAVEYGMEVPKKRKKQNKDEQGKVKLIASREKNHVVIEVADDGPGIDIDNLKKKAVEMGFINKEEVQEMSDEEAKFLICTLGFTTKEEPDELAGRGVGMDVVKDTIESLGGNLFISTQLGKGTTFSLRLPLTLAIIQALLVNLGKQVFAIPLSSIDEVYTVSVSQIKTVKNGEVVNIHNELIPIIRLRKIFNYDDKNDNEQVKIVVVECGENKKGLIVDSLYGQQEIVIKPLDRMLKNLKGLGGATVLGDGQVALILDIRSLLTIQNLGDE